MKAKLIVSVFYLVGLALLSLGVSMMILADLGAGPWDAMYVGLSGKIGLTVGSWVFIVGVLLIIINALLLKATPDYLAVITILLIGSFIDFWLLVVFAQIGSISIWIRIGVLTIGILLIAIGISCYLQSKLARNPVDNLMMTIRLRTGKSISFTKTSMELVVFVLAFFAGGPIGIGTIIVTFIMGPLIQVFYTPVTKLKDSLSNEEIARG